MSITGTVTDTRTTHTLTLPWVTNATRGIVYAEEMREAVSLALAAGLNLIFSGPGGHAKSEFLEAAFGAIQDTEPYVKSFGQGTSTEELYGGLDFDALNRKEGATIQFNPDLSFLPCPIAVFEELFDAPPKVLTSLKDTLTAKQLRNGHQRFPMATRVIAAATNHSPQRIAEGGPEIAALVERFPIQLEVKWSDYTEDRFADLFTAVTGRESSDDPSVTWASIETLQHRAASVEISQAMQRMLARIIVELRHDKVSISPRTAVLAMRLAKAAAAINDRTRVVAQDIIAIAFLPGAHAHRARISQLIDEHRVALGAEEALDRARADLQEARALEQIAINKDDLEQIHSVLDNTLQGLGELRVTSHQSVRRQRIIDEIRELGQQIQAKIESINAEGMLDEDKLKLNQISGELKRVHNILKNTSRSDRRTQALTDLAAARTELEAMHVHDNIKASHGAAMAQLMLVERSIRAH